VFRATDCQIKRYIAPISAMPRRQSPQGGNISRADAPVSNTRPSNIIPASRGVPRPPPPEALQRRLQRVESRPSPSPPEECLPHGFGSIHPTWSRKHSSSAPKILDAGHHRHDGPSALQHRRPDFCRAGARGRWNRGRHGGFSVHARHAGRRDAYWFRGHGPDFDPPGRAKERRSRADSRQRGGVAGDRCAGHDHRGFAVSRSDSCSFWGKQDRPALRPRLFEDHRFWVRFSNGRIRPERRDPGRRQSANRHALDAHQRVVERDFVPDLYLWIFVGYEGGRPGNGYLPGRFGRLGAGLLSGRHKRLEIPCW